VGKGRGKVGENVAKKDNIFTEKVNGILESLDVGIMELWNDGILGHKNSAISLFCVFT
jgi:hypothetical protein